MTDREVEPDQEDQSPRQGDLVAAETLMPLVYDRLRKLAAGFMRGERPEHTLRPTDLVHEAYLRMVDIEAVNWKSRAQFFAVAATQMRRILVEHARKRNALKRGGGATRITLDEEMAPTLTRVVDLLELDDALNRLAEKSTRQKAVAEMRLFAGMTNEEVARALRISERTVKRDWRGARAWLSRELDHSSGRPS